MATPGGKGTGSKIKFKFKIKPSRASNSGDDGAVGTPPPLPPLPPIPVVSSPSLPRYPSVLGTSPLLPLQSPPPAAKNNDEVSDDGDWGEEEDAADWEVGDDADWEMGDDADWEEMEDDAYWGEEEDDQDCEKEKLRRPADNKLYSTLFMSVQKKIPHYIVRYDSAPLNKHTYYTLRNKWNLLLDGKRTYLRPQRDHRVPNDVFRCPDARPRTLGCQEPLLTLVQKYPNKSIVQEMIQILCHHYVLFRRSREDGCCFYRSFFFSYLEYLGQLQDSQAEVTRLIECVTMSKEDFCRLKWDKAYFINPEEYFSSVFCEFEHLVNSVANGLTSNELYKRNLEEIMPLRILSFLRLLTETEIRTHEEEYMSLIPAGMNVLQFCRKEVRPMDVEALGVPVRALTYALGIPVRIEAVGSGLTDGAVQVKRLDFFARSEPGKGHVHLVPSYVSSMTVPEPLDQGSGNLLSSNGTPLLALLRRHNSCDILYRK